MRWGNRGANDETFDWPVALTLPLPAREDRVHDRLCARKSRVSAEKPRIACGTLRG